MPSRSIPAGGNPYQVMVPFADGSLHWVNDPGLTPETLTTGLAMISADMATKVSYLNTGGTGGDEVLNFASPGWEEAGRNHAFVVVSRANASDVIAMNQPTRFIMPDGSQPSRIAFTGGTGSGLWVQAEYIGNNGYWRIKNAFGVTVTP